MTLNGTLKAQTFWALFGIMCAVVGGLFAAQAVTSGEVGRLEATTDAHIESPGHPPIIVAVQANTTAIAVLTTEVGHLTAEVKEARVEQQENFKEILRRLPSR